MHFYLSTHPKNILWVYIFEKFQEPQNAEEPWKTEVAENDVNSIRQSNIKLVYVVGQLKYFY